MAIKIETRNGRIEVVSPYVPEFPGKARKLGGKWNSVAMAWSFDARDEARVRDLCREVYGTDGADDADLVTVRYEEIAGDYVLCESFSFLGRVIARATGRDSGARLGDGVVCIAGSRPTSGGSVKNWRTVIPAGCVLLVRDVPRAKYEEAVAVLAEKQPDPATRTHRLSIEVEAAPAESDGLRHVEVEPDPATEFVADSAVEAIVAAARAGAAALVAMAF